jgi:PTS system mannose-specific IID component
MTMASTPDGVIAAGPPPPLPRSTWIAMFLRLLAIQGSWNYELLMGPGIGFCTEPALRLLPGGPTGAPYHEAVARESRYFNAQPYLAALAVGALARAELDRVQPATIERFRSALCGPLGSIGDRMVWAGWLPCCSLLALALFGLGGQPLAVVAAFLVLYNAGHLALRVWGLRAGYRAGLRLAGTLGTPFFRRGPEVLARAGALLAGIALPLALARVIGPGRHEPLIVGGVLLVMIGGTIVLTRRRGIVEGWQLALAILAAYILYAVLAHG